MSDDVVAVDLNPLALIPCSIVITFSFEMISLGGDLNRTLKNTAFQRAVRRKQPSREARTGRAAQAMGSPCIVVSGSTVEV